MLSDDNSIRSICTETDIIAHIERAHTQHKGIAKAMCDITQTPPHLSTSHTYSLSISLLFSFVVFPPTSQWNDSNLCMLLFFAPIGHPVGLTWDIQHWPHNIQLLFLLGSSISLDQTSFCHRTRPLEESSHIFHTTPLESLSQVMFWFAHGCIVHSSFFRWHQPSHHPSCSI